MGYWRKLHEEEVHELYFLPNIIRLINSKITREVGHVACMGTGEVHIGFCWGNLRERDKSEGLGVDERMTVKCV
jgi:hypothetical protein